MDQLNELREGCLEAYNGILVALKGDGASRASRSSTQCPQFTTFLADLAILVPQVSHIVEFITAIVADQSLSDSCVRGALGLVGFGA